MTQMLGKLYDALRSGGVLDNAREAAAYERDRSDVRVPKGIYRHHARGVLALVSRALAG